jgi:hypothetical protein
MKAMLWRKLFSIAEYYEITTISVVPSQDGSLAYMSVREHGSGGRECETMRKK